MGGMNPVRSKKAQEDLARKKIEARNSTVFALHCQEIQRLQNQGPAAHWRTARPIADCLRSGRQFQRQGRPLPFTDDADRNESGLRQALGDLGELLGGGNGLTV